MSVELDLQKPYDLAIHWARKAKVHRNHGQYDRAASYTQCATELLECIGYNEAEAATIVWDA